MCNLRIVTAVHAILSSLSAPLDPRDSGGSLAHEEATRTTREADWRGASAAPTARRALLALTQAGVSREDAYRLVQRNAMKVWEEGKDFKTELLGDAEVTAALSNQEIEEKFDLGYHTKHVDTIFARVFGVD